MLTEQEYKILKARIDHFNEWVNSIRSKNGWASYRKEDIPDHIKPSDVTNEQRSAVEVYEFVKTPPQRYLVYVKLAENRVTTWMGEELGTITEYTALYRSSFGDTRRNIWIDGINGKKYFGTYYESAGDYARIKIRII